MNLINTQKSVNSWGKLKNYAKKTSRELHKDEISLLANVALRDANSTIKSRENYLCECKDEDFGLQKKEA